MGFSDVFSDFYASLSFIPEVHAEAPPEEEEKDEGGDDDKGDSGAQAEGDDESEGGGDEGGDEEGDEEGGDDEEEEEEDEPVDPFPKLQEGNHSLPTSIPSWNVQYRLCRRTCAHRKYCQSGKFDYAAIVPMNRTQHHLITTKLPKGSVD